jgi:hypothetical protein
LAEEDATDQIEVPRWVAVGVVRVGAVDLDVVDLLSGDVVQAAALGDLVAVRPLVVARGVDQRILKALPQVVDAAVVGLGAVLLAGVDVANVDDLADLRVCIDRVDESRCGAELAVIGRRSRCR